SRNGATSIRTWSITTSSGRRTSPPDPNETVMPGLDPGISGSTMHPRTSARPPDQVRGRGRPMNPSARITPYLYVLPLVALLGFVFGYPLVRIFEFSFKQVRGINGPWIGFRNYELILGQDLFWQSVGHNLLLLIAVPVMVAWSLLISIVLYD